MTGPGQGGGHVALWLGQARPTGVARRQAAGGQRAWEWACVYRGLCSRLLGPGLLSPGQVPLGSSLEAAGASPGPAGRVVTGQRHAGRGRGDSGLPSPQHRGGLRASPGHPFRSPMGKLRGTGRATGEGPARPVSRRARDAGVAKPAGAALASLAHPPSASQMSPKHSRHPRTCSGLACAWLSRALPCRRGLPRLASLDSTGGRCSVEQGPVKGRKEENGRRAALSRAER